MSQNPYAGYGGPEQGMDYGQPPRTSVLAVLSIVSSLICCIPGLGLIGILLGAISLSAISKSGGRVEGKGAAIGGIILGIIVTAFWLFIGFGALQGWRFYTKQMVGTTDAYVQSIAAGDYGDARDKMTPEAAAQVSDEHFDWIAGHMDARLGQIQGAATDFGTMFEAFGKVYGGQQGNQNQTYQGGGSNAVAAPVAIIGDNGYALAWPVFDPNSLDSPGVRIVDMFVLFEDGTYVTLRRDGPAATAAAASGLQSQTRVTEGQPDDLPPPEDAGGEDADAPGDAETEPAGDGEEATDGEPVGMVGPDTSERSAA